LAAPDTRTRLLDTAEHLFGDQGITATSLRALTSAADVNLAAVHYHFGSKEELLHQVLARRIHPVNAERLALLDAAEAVAGEGPVPLETILEAFLEPMHQLHRLPNGVGSRFLRLMSRVMTESDNLFHEWTHDLFGEVAARFSAALHHTLPDVPPEVLRWRFHFMLGAMIMVLLRERSIGGVPIRSDSAEFKPRLIEFVAAGFRAPVSSISEGE